jgi:hypothetical protein
MIPDELTGAPTSGGHAMLERPDVVLDTALLAGLRPAVLLDGHRDPKAWR